MYICIWEGHLLQLKLYFLYPSVKIGKITDPDKMKPSCLGIASPKQHSLQYFVEGSDGNP